MSIITLIGRIIAGTKNKYQVISDLLGNPGFDLLDIDLGEFCYQGSIDTGRWGIWRLKRARGKAGGQQKAGNQSGASRRIIIFIK